VEALRRLEGIEVEEVDYATAEAGWIERWSSMTMEERMLAAAVRAELAMQDGEYPVVVVDGGVVRRSVWRGLVR